MYTLLKRLFSNSSLKKETAPEPARSGIVVVDGQQFDFSKRARQHDGIPHPDWDAAFNWLESLSENSHLTAWLELQRGWLEWLRGAIGLQYTLFESDTALMLTPQSEHMARLKLGYLDATQRRIRRALEDIANPAPGGKEILIAFADADDYYRYVSGFYPEEGTFGMSTGMHLGAGCGHFVTHGTELQKLEPTFVHEMTHSCVRHLPLPLWLNEGLAQAIERRFAGTYEDPYAIIERQQKQITFWSPATIQEFWSGHAFHRPDDRQEMAYALALALTSSFAQDWPRFKSFVLAAKHDDAGATAAHAHLDLDLGEYVRLVLEQSGDDWTPQPAGWSEIPEAEALVASFEHEPS